MIPLNCQAEDDAQCARSGVLYRSQFDCKHPLYKLGCDIQV